MCGNNVILNQAKQLYYLLAKQHFHVWRKLPELIYSKKQQSTKTYFHAFLTWNESLENCIHNNFMERKKLQKLLKLLAKILLRASELLGAYNIYLKSTNARTLRSQQKLPITYKQNTFSKKKNIYSVHSLIKPFPPSCILPFSFFNKIKLFYTLASAVLIRLKEV